MSYDSSFHCGKENICDSNELSPMLKRTRVSVKNCSVTSLSVLSFMGTKTHTKQLRFSFEIWFVLNG